MLGHLQQRVFLEGADHDQINIARHYAGGVGDGLAMAQLHLAAGEHQRLPTHLAHADIKADPGPCRGLFKDQRNHAPAQRLVVIGRALWATGAGGFHRAGLIEDRPERRRVGFVDVKKVVHIAELFAGFGTSREQ